MPIRRRALLALLILTWSSFVTAQRPDFSKLIEAIEKDGAYFKNRFGEVKKHPAIGVERDALIVFARLVRELDLDVDPPSEAKRPPALHSFRGGR